MLVGWLACLHVCKCNMSHVSVKSRSVHIPIKFFRIEIHSDLLFSVIATIPIMHWMDWSFVMYHANGSKCAVDATKSNINLWDESWTKYGQYTPNNDADHLQTNQFVFTGGMSRFIVGIKILLGQTIRHQVHRKMEEESKFRAKPNHKSSVCGQNYHFLHLYRLQMQVKRAIDIYTMVQFIQRVD